MSRRCRRLLPAAGKQVRSFGRHTQNSLKIYLLFGLVLVLVELFNQFEGISCFRGQIWNVSLDNNYNCKGEQTGNILKFNLAKGTIIIYQLN